MLHTFTQQNWVENFRMSKETFLYICGKLQNTVLLLTCLELPVELCVR